MSFLYAKKKNKTKRGAEKMESMKKFTYFSHFVI